MGQSVSKTPSAVRLEAEQAQATVLLYSLCWHGSPPSKCLDAQATPGAPLYDSDDETTDTGVISALAMTDPADLPSPPYSQRLARSHSARVTSTHRQLQVHAPILQSLSTSKSAGTDHLTAALPQLPSPVQQQQQQAPHNTLARAVSASAAGPSSSSSSSKHAVQTPATTSSSSSRRPRYKEATMTAAAAAAAVTAAVAAARQAGGGCTNRAAPSAHLRKQQQQQGGRYAGRVVVPLSAAALDAVGAPCRIGGDLPPESLQSMRGSGADVVGVRPLHHLHMMQLHRQQQQQHQQQQKQHQQQQVQQAICAQVQAQAVWGWQVGAGNATQVAT